MRRVRPPVIWERLLSWLLPPDQREAAAGDALEELATRAAADGEAAARAWYRKQVLRSIAPGIEYKVRRLSERRRKRARGGGEMIGRWMSDFRLATRMLLRRPGFSGTVLVTLALGIGATTALFGVFRAVFLQPIPLPEPERIAFIMEQGSFGCCGPASGPDYVDWAQRQRVFSGMGAISPRSVTLTGGDQAERVVGTYATASVFEMLGVEPAVGRVFTSDEQADPSVVLLADGLWQRQFGGLPDVLGATVVINQSPYTVIGVMPPGFDVPSPWTGTAGHELYLPFPDEWLAENRGSHSYPVVARLASSVTLDDAQADMDRILRDLSREYPDSHGDRTARVFSAHQYMFGNVGRQLGLILGAAALVLLIACGNVAGMQLARAAGRETELAVRLALGAPRRALVRLLFSESLLMATLGGLLGVLVAGVAVGALQAVLPPTIPRVDTIRVDAWTIGFALAATALTAVVFGMMPALLTTGGDIASRVREGGASASAPRKERVRDYFIVGQIALGLVLANGAALLVQSYALLRAQEAGFEPDGVLTVSMSPSGERYDDRTALADYYDRVLEQVRAVPGVERAGTVSRLPLAGGSNGNVLVEGRGPRENAGEGPLVEVASVTGDYFQAMGIDLLRGRALLPEDSISSAVGVVINRRFADEGWPGEDALGKRFSFDDDPPAWRTVVGVVEDVRQWGLEQPPVSQAYFPLTHGWTGSGYVTVRTATDAAALSDGVRRAILDVDPTQAPADIRTMTERVDRAFAQRRFYTTLIGIFAGAALFLAAAGVYGTVSYYVTRRTRELGVRMALGAGASGITRLVLGRSAGLAARGVAVGLVGVWASTSVVSRLVYGVGAFEPLTLVVGCVLLAAVTLVAAGLPARRAVRVPPVLALRSE